MNFVDGHVQQTLSDPDAVYESVNDPSNAWVYYRIVKSDDPYSVGAIFKFVLVVVHVTSDPTEIKTAYYKQGSEPREHGQSNCIFRKGALFHKSI